MKLRLITAKMNVFFKCNKIKLLALGWLTSVCCVAPRQGQYTGQTMQVCSDFTILVLTSMGPLKVAIKGVERPALNSPYRQRALEYMFFWSAVQTLRCEVQGTRNGIPLAYVYRASDNSCINYQLIQFGYAKYDTKTGNLSQLKCEANARRFKRGLWSIKKI
jgi:endonuclease YncB( thermonuclease family)